MFYENNYGNSSNQHYSNNNYYDYQQYQYDSQCQVNYPAAESNISYQEDINKCMSYVNSDYNSYDPSGTYDSSTSSSNMINSQQESLVKDSGITKDFDENSTYIAETPIHKHQNKYEEDECPKCREAVRIMLSTPFINVYDYKFKSPNSKKVSLTSEDINYVEYELFEGFRFAKPKKYMLTNAFNGFFIHPSMFEDMDKARAEFNYNGQTVNISSERKNMPRENEVQRLYPMTQHYDYKNELYSFQPNANSTPAKYLYNYHQQQQQQQQLQPQYCHVINQNQYLNANALAWKKPVVLDPRLSAQYDAVFPSLDGNSNNNYNSYNKQSTSINAMDNNVSLVFNKRMY